MVRVRATAFKIDRTGQHDPAPFPRQQILRARDRAAMRENFELNLEGNFRVYGTDAKRVTAATKRIDPGFAGLNAFATLQKSRLRINTYVVVRINFRAWQMRRFSSLFCVFHLTPFLPRAPTIASGNRPGWRNCCDHKSASLRRRPRLTSSASTTASRPLAGQAQDQEWPARPIPAARAKRTRSDRFFACSLSMMRARWISTVRGEMPSSWAAALLERP